MITTAAQLVACLVDATGDLRVVRRVVCSALLQAESMVVEWVVTLENEKVCSLVASSAMQWDTEMAEKWAACSAVRWVYHLG